MFRATRRYKYFETQHSEQSTCTTEPQYTHTLVSNNRDYPPTKLYGYFCEQLNNKNTYRQGSSSYGVTPKRRSGTPETAHGEL